MSKALRDRALAVEPDLAKKIPIVVLNKDKSAIIPFEELYPLARAQ
jgi:hypothetical protein